MTDIDIDTQTELCACGKALHYTDPDIERAMREQIAELGEHVVVVGPDGSFRVPRHYIALHGLKAARLAQLAALHQWPRVAAR